MKNIRQTLILIFFSTILVSCGNKSDVEPDQSKTYTTFENDPLQLKIYTLENGLKVYMSINDREPRIQTSIAVKTGSKNDPPTATGLAHYLEHMVFKGTSKIGSLNWEKEKPLLGQISNLYEKHRNTTDSLERLHIYAAIDSLSYEASKYVATNEYDQLISQIGGEGSNAFTSLDQTVYITNVPSNELKKWITVEAERFNELVLRIFHTELEAVYEEFNQSQDSDYDKAWNAMAEALFQKHTYGTQTTIGKGEHLKNPSMEKIHDYFNTYYVPNNMAICMSGDFNPDSAVAWIEEEFGKLKPKQVPEKDFPEEDPIKEPIRKEVVGPMAEWVDIGFRFPGAGTDEAFYIEVISEILQNGKAGLIDLNLNQKQEVLDGSAYSEVLDDYSILGFTGRPKLNQSLEEVETLLLAQLDSIKAGAFEDWLPEAIANNMEFNDKWSATGNWYRVNKMLDQFVLGIDYKTELQKYDRIRKLKKSDIIDFAKKHFNNNYVTVYKRTGESEGTFKVPKPKITPVVVNRDTNSTYFKHLLSKESERLKPVFVDFDKRIYKSTVGKQVPFYHTTNEYNDIFTLYYALDMGSRNNKLLDVAIKYLPYLGTSKYSPEELKKKLFRYGLDFDVYSSERRTYIYLNGLDKNFNEAVALFEHILADCSPNDEAWTNVVASIEKERQDEVKSKYSILYSGLRNYARYGKYSPALSRLPIAKLKQLKGEQLVEIIKGLTGYQHYIYYHGSMKPADVVPVLNEKHKVAGSLQKIPDPEPKPEKDYESPQVFYSNYDMVQTEFVMLHKGPLMDIKLMPYAAIFSEYFGSGFTSIVYQEIRESRALAYSAFARFSVPSRLDRSHYTQVFIGTQNDKLSAAIAAMQEILNNMPESEKAFNAAKDAALKSIETSRITGSSVFWQYQDMKDIGVNYDLRKDTYAAIKKMTLEDFKAFFNQYISGQQYNYVVLGNQSLVDMKELQKLGNVNQLKVNELFTQ